MKNNLLKSALVAAATAVLCVQAAHAQIVYNNGDLILGVEATGGTGASFDYEVNLGNITLFTAGNNIDFSSTVLNSDLSSSSASGGFGSGYQTRSDVFFSVVGTNLNKNADVSDPQIGAGTLYKKALYITALSTPLAQSGNTLSGGGSDPQASTAIGGIVGLTPTTPGGEAAFLSTSIGNSYTAAEYNGTTQQFQQPTIDQLSLLGASQGQSLNLYLLNPASDTNSSGVGKEYLLGDFTFQNGDLKFNTATAPEPSTYALLMLGAGALVWLVRRRSVNS